MASKVKSRSRSSIPVARAIPVATAVPLKAASTSANRVLNRIKKTGVWMTSNNWLMVSKLITVVGLIIFAISTASGTVDGELAAYYWMGIGVITTLIMTFVVTKYYGASRPLLITFNRTYNKQAH